jgi:geranylgeranyl pyrophosphate synthase
MMAKSLTELLSTYRKRVDTHLDQLLTVNSIDPVLQEAMKYGLFNGGKRVRPALVYMVAQVLGASLDRCDDAAAAIECIHSYSLIHDDLPAMDNDELRRGKPTCHIAFDEATAILAGDALQCLAFEVLSAAELPTNQKLDAIRVLSLASGHRGMCVGQSFDLRHEGLPLALEQLEAMHQHKTGALITAAVELGWVISDCNDVEVCNALVAYSKAIGLAFQVKDDILDIEADTETLGKPQGSDLERNKPTYPALLGLDGAKDKLEQLHRNALSAIESLPYDVQILKEMADYIVNRTH